jgi:hypothetical protein
VGPTSEYGYTMWGLFERQLKHIKWIRGMGDGEINILLPQAQLLMVDGAEHRHCAERPCTLQRWNQQQYTVSARQHMKRTASKPAC